jgi:hypothetical protein
MPDDEKHEKPDFSKEIEIPSSQSLLRSIARNFLYDPDDIFQPRNFGARFSADGIERCHPENKTEMRRHLRECGKKGVMPFTVRNFHNLGRRQELIEIAYSGHFPEEMLIELDKALTKGGRVQEIDIEYRMPDPLDPFEKQVYSLEDFRDRLIPSLIRNRYHVSDLWMDWSWDVVRRGDLDNDTLSYSIKANVHAYTKKVALSFTSWAFFIKELEEGGTMTISVPDDGFESFDFAKEETRSEILRLREWFNFLRDKHTGQRFLVEPH